MRISARQIQTLKNCVARHFGPNARLWLFGSRVNDALRGGDYDLYIETDLKDPDDIVERRLKTLASMHSTPEFEGEKIDLVVRPSTDEESSAELPIYRVARQDGIPL